MDNFFRQLNQKGPGGIPKWIYAAGAVIILYLAYRWFSNRGSSSSSSSTPDTSGADTSSDTTSTDASSDPGTDTTPPDDTETTAPVPTDTSPQFISTGPNLLKRLKKAHPSVHDKKQGTHGTKKKAVHSGSKNHKQHPKSHAPKKNGVKHSGEKAKATSGIPASRPQAFASVHSTSTPVAVKKVEKSNPAPIAAPTAAKRVEAKHPIKKK